MHYLVTGHTGFKGAWLALLLNSRGHTVSGLALDPEPGNLYETARVAELMAADLRIDIRDSDATAAAIRTVAPDVVVHMAAQPLVQESYRDPRTTFTTNVIGTLNVLDAVSQSASVRAHLVVTTDKVYRNVEQARGYTEGDPLGAGDPYSTSKAMADLLTQSWIRSFPGVPTAIARGGNVIGGGDTSRDRLIPDLVRSFAAGEPAVLRNPDAVRPWQHVLDCLDGYLEIVDALVGGTGEGEWNIGPGEESFVTVGAVATLAAENWGRRAGWLPGEQNQPHEAGLLALDPGKAERELHWKNRLRFPLGLDWAIQWYSDVDAGADPRQVTEEQIERYRNQVM